MGEVAAVGEACEWLSYERRPEGRCLVDIGCGLKLRMDGGPEGFVDYGFRSGARPKPFRSAREFPRRRLYKVETRPVI